MQVGTTSCIPLVFLTTERYIHWCSRPLTCSPSLLLPCSFLPSTHLSPGQHPFPIRYWCRFIIVKDMEIQWKVLFWLHYQLPASVTLTFPTCFHLPSIHYLQYVVPLIAYQPLLHPPTYCYMLAIFPVSLVLLQDLDQKCQLASFVSIDVSWHAKLNQGFVFVLPVCSRILWYWTCLLTRVLISE